MRLSRLALASAMVLLVGCGSAASSGGSKSPSVTPPDNLEDARKLWQQRGVGTYAITAQMTCYCPPDLVQPIRLEVEAGTLVSWKGLDRPLENLTSNDAQRLTVEGLFEFIDKAQRREAHKLEVSYDRQYGFPKRIDYDGHPMIADDERQYRLTDFDPGVTR